MIYGARLIFRSHQAGCYDPVSLTIDEDSTYIFIEALNYMLCFEQPQGRGIVNYENTLRDCGVYYQGGVPSEREFLC